MRFVCVCVYWPDDVATCTSLNDVILKDVVGKFNLYCAIKFTLFIVSVI